MDLPRSDLHKSALHTAYRSFQLLAIAWLALGAHAVATARTASSESPARTPISEPTTWLWVWDRPQLFKEVGANQGVAYLHASVRLSGDSARTQYRQWPLRLSASTPMQPVVHVTLDNIAPAPVTAAQRHAIATAVSHAAQHSRSGQVQLDFEARYGQRTAYLDLLRSLQPLRLPGPGRDPVRLSVTALASWCMSDPWIDPTLVDEIVPMYFRMGHETALIRQRLGAAGQAPVRSCQGAAGFLWGEEAWPVLTRIQRRYVFHRGAWTDEDITLLGQRALKQGGGKQE